MPKVLLEDRRTAQPSWELMNHDALMINWFGLLYCVHLFPSSSVVALHAEGKKLNSAVKLSTVVLNILHDTPPFSLVNPISYLDFKVPLR